MDTEKNAKRMESMLHVLAWVHMAPGLEHASMLGMENRAPYPHAQAPTDEQLVEIAKMLFQPIQSIRNERDAKLFLARLFFVHGMTIQTGFDPAKSFQGYRTADVEWMYDPETAQALSETLATGRLNIGLARLYELTEEIMLEMHMIR